MSIKRTYKAFELVEKMVADLDILYELLNIVNGGIR
jgi:hypothetical protein